MNLSKRLIEDIKKASKITSFCHAYPDNDSDLVTYFRLQLPNTINELFEAFSFFEGNEDMRSLCGMNVNRQYLYLNPLREELENEINKFLNGEKTFLKLLSPEQSRSLIKEILDDLHNSIEEKYSLFESRYIRARKAS
jgi:hypothetical protein